MIPTKFDLAKRPWLPYVAPMFTFLLLTSFEGEASKVVPYPVAYAVKVVLVAIVAFACRDAWRDLGPMPGAVPLIVAVLAGLGVAAAWVGLDGLYPPIPFLGTRSGYDPSPLAPGARAGFLAARFFGLVLVVPLIEELFWRSFLMRWIVDQDFLNVPIGRVTPAAAAITSLAFAAAHPEWLPALLTGLAWAGLLAWSKSLSACVVSHATANLALGIYVVATGGESWKFL